MFSFHNNGEKGFNCLNGLILENEIKWSKYAGLMNQTDGTVLYIVFT